jgi:glucose/arabinose dehydrogenase
MIRLTHVALAGAVVFAVAACAKKEQPATDTATAMAAPAAAPAPSVSLADFAGRWNMVTRPESGNDTAVTKVVMVATADTTGWVMELPSGKKVAHHVTFSGDSVTVKSEPYASMRRKGKQVWTEGVYRLENGKMVGTTIAHYMKSGADSVLRLKAEGTKQ